MLDCRQLLSFLEDSAGGAYRDQSLAAVLSQPGS